MILRGLRIPIAAACVTLTLAATACGGGSSASDSTAAETSTSQSSATSSAATTSPASIAPPTTELTPATPPSSAADWANFEYQSVECGSLTPITLTNGEFTNRESAVVVTLGQTVVLESGDTLVTLNCLAGPSGDTRSTELLLFGPDGAELAHEMLPAGEQTINPDGTGSMEFEVYGPDDPRCCPTGTSRLTFQVTDGKIVVNDSEVITPPEGAPAANPANKNENVSTVPAEANTEEFPFDSFAIPQLGEEPVRGSGCGASGDLGDTIPDGWWYGSVQDLTSDSMNFDLQCVYFGESAAQPIQDCVDELDGDPDGMCTAGWSETFWPVNDNDRTRAVPVSPDASRVLEDPGGCPFDVAAGFMSVIHVESGQAVYLRAICPFG